MGMKDSISMVWVVFGICRSDFLRGEQYELTVLPLDALNDIRHRHLFAALLVDPLVAHGVHRALVDHLEVKVALAGTEYKAMGTWTRPKLMAPFHSERVEVGAFPASRSGLEDAEGFALEAMTYFPRCLADGLCGVPYGLNGVPKLLLSDPESFGPVPDLVVLGPG
jgi:hypothetical protein